MSDEKSRIPTPFDFFSLMNQFVQPMLEASAQAKPPGDAAADPLAYWKSVQEKNEQVWTQFMAQVVAAPDFAAGLGQAASAQAAYRENIRKTAQAYLDAAGMPSRQDITRLAELVVGVDAKLDDLNDRLDERSAEAAIERLNRRLAGIEARLDRLEARLEQSLAGPESRSENKPGLSAGRPEQPGAPPAQTKRAGRRRTEPDKEQPA